MLSIIINKNSEQVNERQMDRQTHSDTLAYLEFTDRGNGLLWCQAYQIETIW